MKIVVKMAAVATLALLMVVCPCRSYQKRTRRPLIGTEWQLIQLNGQNVKADPTKYHIQFLAEGNRFSGVGECNRLMGTFRTDESRTLKIGPVAATRMACPDMKQEAAFCEALGKTTHYDMDGPTLLLLSNGEMVAVFQAVPVVKK